MTQEDKELLLKDLCVRLPYGVIVHCKDEYNEFHEVEEIARRDREWEEEMERGRDMPTFASRW